MSLHRYVRRLIRWASTPGDEDRDIESRERWLHRISWLANSRPDRAFYYGRSLQSLAEVRAAFDELERRCPGSCLRLNEHVALIEYMESHDGRLPAAPSHKEAA